VISQQQPRQDLAGENTLPLPNGRPSTTPIPPTVAGILARVWARFIPMVPAPIPRCTGSSVVAPGTLARVRVRSRSFCSTRRRSRVTILGSGSPG